MHSRYFAIAAAVLMSVFSTSAATDPQDWRRVDQDQSELMDLFVDRGGPYLFDTKEATPFDQGQLGVLLPSYGRFGLYLAYRGLTHKPAELAIQFKNTPPDEFLHNQNDHPRDLENWLVARRVLAGKEPPRRILKNHRIGQELNSYLNCSDSAFKLATANLQSLSSDKQVAPQDVQDWIAAQDAVFDQCSDLNGAPSLDIPQELTSSTPRNLQQLRLYQIAAATFYRGNYTEALRRFDIIAADKTHPMRSWATLVAMRSLLRTGSTDESHSSREKDFKTRSITPADFNLASAENQRNMKQLYDKIATRAKATLADKTLANIHEPTRNLLKQSAVMLLPDLAYTNMTAELGRFDKDYRVNGELFHWASIGDKLFDDKSHEELMTDLRHQHEYFDWIRTIQGCAELPWSPNFLPGRCEQEQQHALERWQVKKSNTWLVATMITAQQITPSLEKALSAAARVNSKDIEYLTLRYYTARLLRRAGRVAEARAIIDEVMQPPNYGISGNLVKDPSGANNLFKQEALALAKTDEQALPYLLRQSSRRLGADGDELLNRRLSSEDLLRMAENPAVNSDLAEQLLVASWWRSDMVGKKSVAEHAARLIGSRVPTLSKVIAEYLQANNDSDRHFIVAKAALHYRISPRVYAVTQHFGEPSFPRDTQFWCSFQSADYARRARIERAPTPAVELTADVNRRDIELTLLRLNGSGAEWMGRIALAKAKITPDEPSVRVMLLAVARAGNRNCGSSEGAEISNAARQILGDAVVDAGRARHRMVRPVAAAGANATPVSETDARALYEQIKLSVAGQREFHVAHILFAKEGEANSALSSIKSGGSFEQLAKSSMDAASGSKGGDLGWSLPNNYVKPFSDAVSSMRQPGLYDHVIRTPFGWHVMRVLDSRPYTVPPFETIRPAIEQRIRTQRQQQQPVTP